MMRLRSCARHAPAVPRGRLKPAVPGDVLDKIKARIPVGRLGDASEIARRRRGSPAALINSAQSQISDTIL